MADISTPISISLEEHLTPEEREQILQTIEMFESIAQASPDDYQSLEILKEAYWKIGRQADSVKTARQLADAYMRLGQYSSALLEYEGILQQELPAGEAENIQAIIVELETKLHPGKQAQGKGQIALDYGVDTAVIGLDEQPEGTELLAPDAGQPTPLRLVPDGSYSPSGFNVPGGLNPRTTSTEASLIATSQTRNSMHGMAARNIELSEATNGLEPLVKFLIQHRLVSHEVANAARARVEAYNLSPEVQEHRTVSTSLLHEVVNAGVEVDVLLAGIIDRTKIAYIPLENYEIDRQIVKMLPENLTLGRIIVPFDIVSRTMMVALDNPFDAAAKAAVQQSVDYHIQWHIAKPAALQKALKDAYRLR